MDLLTGIVEVHLGNVGGCLGCTNLIGTVKPVLLETIEHIWIRNGVAAGQCHMRQIDGTNQIGGLL